MAVTDTTAAKTPVNGTITPPADPKHPVPAWAGPDFARLLRVERGENYTTRAVSLVTLPPNAPFARITTATAAPTPLYTTVQCAPDAHIELNSDLRYINHSCSPNLIFDMDAWEVRVSDKGLHEGDDLTFFYPSTEWAMDRGFECACGEMDCLGWIGGARELPEKALSRYWLSRHIREMKEQQRRAKGLGDGVDMTLGGKTTLGFRSVAGGGLS